MVEYGSGVILMVTSGSGEAWTPPEVWPMGGTGPADAATVAVQTTSVRNDGTHQCTGTVDLARGRSSASWAPARRVTSMAT